MMDRWYARALYAVVASFVTVSLCSGCASASTLNDELPSGVAGIRTTAPLPPVETSPPSITRAATPPWLEADYDVSGRMISARCAEGYGPYSVAKSVGDDSTDVWPGSGYLLLGDGVQVSFDGTYVPAGLITKGQNGRPLVVALNTPGVYSYFVHNEGFEGVPLDREAIKRSSVGVVCGVRML